jgi:hypothetical protein
MTRQTIDFNIIRNAPEIDLHQHLVSVFNFSGELEITSYTETPT